MPLVGTNFYGTQVQRTPWDDADAQNAAAQDQWRMAQFADARLRQGQSDARAMNQDNLNFGVWQSGRSDARDARTTAAQLALEKQRQAQEELMFGKRSAYDTERDTRIGAREDARTASERDWAMNNPMAKRQFAEYDAQAEQRRAAEARREAGRKWRMSNDPGTPAGAPGEGDPFGTRVSDPAIPQGYRAGLKAAMDSDDPIRAYADLMANDPSGEGFAASDAMLMELMRDKRNFEGARKADLSARLASDTASDRVSAEAEITADPKLAKTIYRPKRAALQFNPADAKATDVINSEMAQGTIRQVLNSLSRNNFAQRVGRDDETIAQDAQALASVIQEAADRIGKSTGYDPLSVRKVLADRIGQLDTTGGWNVLARIITDIPTLGLAELGARRSERTAAVEEALKLLGITQPTE